MRRWTLVALVCATLLLSGCDGLLQVNAEELLKPPQLTQEQALCLCAGDYKPLMRMDSDFAMELYTRMQQFCYRPKCVVEYDRIAFAVPENDTRITLDANLRASESRLDLFAPDLALYPAGVPGQATMEVKFNGFLLSYIKDLVSLSSRTRCSSSKYCIARNITLREDS